MQQIANKSKFFVAIFLTLAIVSCIFIGEVMAGKGKGGADIILYNGNIVVRSGKGKGKGGNIVVANSQHHHKEMEMPYWGHGGHGDHWGRKRR